MPTFSRNKNAADPKDISGTARKPCFAAETKTERNSDIQRNRKGIRIPERIALKTWLFGCRKRCAAVSGAGIRHYLFGRSDTVYGIYVQHFNRQVDDSKNLRSLIELIKNKKILFIAPDASLNVNKQKIFDFIKQENTFVVAINNYLPDFPTNAIFYSNMNHYQEFKVIQNKDSNNKIFITSNIKTEAENNEMIFNYLSLIKFGWINIDTSFILALRLFIKAGVKKFTFAGFDGFSTDNKNYYYSEKILTATEKDDLLLLTKETHEMLDDIIKSNNITAEFLTPSVYEMDFAKAPVNI